MKTRITDIISAMNEATSGSFVGITDYISSTGDVSSIVGHIGFNYERLKSLNIERLIAFIEARELWLDADPKKRDEDIGPISVTGQCNYDTDKGEWNGRKKKMPMKDYTITFSVVEVVERAKEILDGLQNAKPRASNKTALTDKDNGLAIYNETGNFNFSLLVENETYKVEASKQAKADMDIKVKAKAPITALNEAIRNVYERKIKTFTIAEGKFKSVTIAKQKFGSEAITL